MDIQLFDRNFNWRELVGECPARRLRPLAQRDLRGQIVHLDDHAIHVDGQRLLLLEKLADEAREKMSEEARRKEREELEREL